MNTLPDILKGCILFKDMSSEDLLTCLNYCNYIIKRYSKGNLVFLEGHKCEEIGILLKGLLKVQTLYPSGKSLTFFQLKPVEIFGEVIVFSKTSKCPATISAIEDSEIIFIKKWDLISCSSNCHQFMENFLGLLSDRLLTLNKKVKMLSLENIRQKIRNFLMEEYEEQKSNIIKVFLSRKDMAQYMGIQRPSLSRELSKMREEGIIEFDRKSIIIKNVSALNKL